MRARIIFLLILGCLLSAKVAGQVADLAAHHEVKDSIIARFNRHDFKSIYRLADTSFHTPEQNLTRFFTNNRNSFGQIVSAKFLADSLCEGCNNKRGKYYLVAFQLRSFLMVLEVTPEKKFSSFGLLNYTYPNRSETVTIPTSNPRQDSFDRSVDSAAKEYFRNPFATALSIGIIKNGKRLTYHYGETAIGTSRLPTDKTLYELGSITKTFTSTILANAVLENRLNLKDDIRKYLPEPYPNLEYKGHPVTLQDLANHTSRIPSVPDDFFSHSGYDPLVPWNNYTIPMFWQSLHRVALDTVPGYKEQYSNVAVALLGRILENVYKQSFDSLIEKYVTEPFKMRRTGTRLGAWSKGDTALKYSANGNSVPFWNQPAFTPAGVGVLTCLDDMLNYVAVQMAENDRAVKLTHQITANNSGLGWGVGNLGTKYKKYEHSGGTNGFSTNVRMFPDLKAGMIILANNDVNLAKLIRLLSPLVVQ